MRQHQLQGAIYCLIATASWGAMFPVMTGALVRVDPFTFTSLRYLIAGAEFLHARRLACLADRPVHEKAEHRHRGYND
jgi:drug/metabolite transporter (DMT)-like permease